MDTITTKKSRSVSPAVKILPAPETITTRHSESIAIWEKQSTISLETEGIGVLDKEGKLPHLSQAAYPAEMETPALSAKQFPLTSLTGVQPVH